MASTMSENGDTSDEVSQQSVGARVNGEVNGSYDEPMEVDEPVKPVKKINSSDINCISEITEKDSNSLSEPSEQTNSNSEDKLSEGESAVENEVPEKEEGTSSNGFGEQQDEDAEVNNSEENHEENVEENHEDEDESQDGENQEEGENQDDDVVLMEEEEGDPFAGEANPDEVENLDEDEGEKQAEEEQDDQNGTTKDEQKDSSENEKNENQENENAEELQKSDEKPENDKDKSDKDSPEDESKGDNLESNEKDDCEKMEVDGEKNDESPEKSKTEEDNDKTPDKGKKKKTQQQPINITPRRSSRNVNKPKTYIDEPDIKPTTNTTPKKVNDDPDIEEIVPQDPLAMDSPVSDKKNKKTVVVNDPKRLVEIASGSKQTKPGKKEPTLVIIDTNSILSGRGPVPVSPSSPLGHSTNSAGSSRSQGYSVLPVALPAQGMYAHPLKQGQVKPVVMSQSPPVTPSPPPATPKPPPVILPSLTDDMYVVEAPSFIVPYVYEKPPIKPLKNFVDQVEQAIKEIKAQLEKEKNEGEKKSEEEEKKSEDTDKEKSDSSDKEKTKDKDADAKDEKMDVDSDTAKSSKEGDSKSKEKEETKDLEKSSEEKSSEAKADSEKSGEDGKTDEEKSKKSSSYFDNPLGKFFIQIGVNLVQEHVQTDLLRSQKRKKEREGSKCTPEVQQAMNSLIRSLEFSKETNEPFKLELKKCEFCSFKTESALVMAHHLETPHMRNYVYRCNFCPLEVRSPHDILYHMEAEHNVRGRLERAPAFHQCPSCPFEDNQKGKLSRHLLSCAKKYRPERNQEPPLDFEPPAKIPRVSRNRPTMSPGNAVYQAAMSGLKQGSPLLPKLVPAPAAPPGLIRGRGRPQMINRYLGDMRTSSVLAAQHKAMAAQMRPGMLYRPSGSNSQPQVLLPASYQLANTQLYQVTNHGRGLSIGPPPLTLPTLAQQSVAASVAGGKTSVTPVGSSAAKLLQQPSISITPLPRQQPPPPSPAPPAPPPANKPGRPAGSSKATFVICEICDGYIKDLEQLRNHMQWIHKVKIHPKMIYNRPPLNCQKCQFRFFTDQGLERHLLGSHGLVTSSMQEAANKGKDGGRCPVCGRVYQWKLLNHVARDHNMSLKPAHLSYKCTVCTATFGMYKQFENHVYSAHSVVAKRVMDKKPSAAGQASTSSQGDMLKPLKINDEITIIPQPARSKTKPASSNNRNPQKKV